MEEAPDNGKELSHSAHANGMNVNAPKFTYQPGQFKGSWLILSLWVFHPSPIRPIR